MKYINLIPLDRKSQCRYTNLNRVLALIPRVLDTLYRLRQSQVLIYAWKSLKYGSSVHSWFEAL
jgi:hypothetical protein